ncbi:MAG: hypothetical protein KC656_33600 [Myxococcales bacterium]|nr:hypothetical protein [Myxococcales bacterium]
MTWLLTMAWAQQVDVRVPFPTRRMYDGVADTVCVQFERDLGTPDVAVEDGAFTVSCRPAGTGTQACVRLDDGSTWPDRVPAIRCEGARGTLVVRPVQAFDPFDDIEDGVRVVRAVDSVQAVYRTSRPDTVGSLPGGACGIRGGGFWFRTRSRARHQACTLVWEDGTVLDVPILLVRSLAPDAEL